MNKVWRRKDRLNLREFTIKKQLWYITTESHWCKCRGDDGPLLDQHTATTVDEQQGRVLTLKLSTEKGQMKPTRKRHDD